ncbi:MAG: ATP-dependent RecD-like DNA helicase [Actinobacteria bacterium]|nr:ATP-dependent RecD-like DNA helicase [Actinomycetota bacterium]
MTENATEKITGSLKNILYRNTDNNYFIGRFICENSNEPITIVGYAFEIQPGERVAVEGRWVKNKKYGMQFEISSLEVMVPVTADGIEKYIGSGMIKGIGPVMAKRIVKKFGMDTLEILDSSPGRLSEIDGFAQKRIAIVKEEWKKQKYVREIMIFMQSYDISNNYALKIYNNYGNDSINVLKTNPYRLIEDIAGIGFKTADRIAERLGIKKESVFRIKSGILYIMRMLTEAGNCYCPLDELVNHAMGLLDIGQADICSCINMLTSEDSLVIRGEDDKKVYLTCIYEDEVFVARKLREIKGSKANAFCSAVGKTLEIPVKKHPGGKSFLSTDNNEYIERIINELTADAHMMPDSAQMEAIKKSLSEKVVIITGSPGTGKSTILDIIIAFFKSMSGVVLIAAPTGRAAKRLEQATGCQAKTIHRLLKYQPKMNRFLKDENDMLAADVIIIDESSMLDIRLFRALLKAIEPHTRLILVGDVDQLPAVGPGNILSDIINSGIFCVVKLEKIYRQGGKSQIIYNAHRIRDGIYPVIKNSENNDFFFFDKTDPESAVDTVIDLALNRIPSNFNFKAPEDIQVIVPTNKGIAGVNNINLKIQERINKTNIFYNKGAMRLGVNDKVIQLKNNYEKEVYNGDIGYIKIIDFENQEISVDFDGKLVHYDFHDTDQLTLSYAISIHKSQGSEFRCVIIPILTSHYMLLQRNLLYTAITRAREVAVIVGSKKAIGMAVSRNITDNRFTGLKDLLAGCF